MHTTLGKLGFKRAGSEWTSKQNNDNLLLFVKAAAQPVVAPDVRPPASLSGARG